MANIYAVNDSWDSEALDRIRCDNEANELQLLLEKNLDFLPGDQINPDDPRRWLLVKREMPVPDPSTGIDRWSIDFLLVDQDAIPTFVECKRFSDTRARREIVGQVLEYAANGHYYWTSDTLRSLAEKASLVKGVPLEESLLALHANNEESPEQFFDRVQQNLREGQVRLVFFLEESPFELRSVVDFLNRQMERSEILLVEARQYCKDNIRIVVPTLFGYTEQARLVKKPITITSASALRRKKWNRESFFENARTKLDESIILSLEQLIERCVSMGCQVGYGSGSKSGSFSIYERSIFPRSFFTVWTKGRLSVNFGWLNGAELTERTRDRFRDLIEERMGIEVQDISKFPTYPIDQWSNKVEGLISALNEVLSGLKYNN